MTAAGWAAETPHRACAQSTQPSHETVLLAPEQAVRRDLDQLAATLTGRSSTQAQRDEAARRLTSRGSPQAREILIRALRDGGHDPALAVARAVSEDPQPDPRFIGLLVQLLGSERLLHDAVAKALAHQGNNDTARNRLIDFALDARQQVSPARVVVIRALGTIIDKSVAQTLLDLLTDKASDPLIASAAADALAEMTGITGNGRDAVRWQQWFAANASKSGAEWRAAVYPGRTAHLEDIAQRYARLSAEIDNILTEQYQTAPTAKEKAAAVMRFLNSNEPDVRLVGARIVRTAFLSSQPYSPQAPDRLAELVGDSDARVRLEVAETLRAINYPGALDALLIQLSQEQDPDVKVALMGAVGQIGDYRVAPVFRRLLHDENPRVAMAAAKAIRSAGPGIVKANPALGHEIAQELWTIAQQQPANPAAVDFQVACIDALTPLRDLSLELPLMKLLDPNTPDRVRGAALRNLGELGDPHAADTINQWLMQERDSGNRLDAIEALGKTGSFAEDSQTLYSFFGPSSREPDPAVRQRAWVVFQSLLPSASKQLLAEWAQTMIADPQRRIAVLLALNAKLLGDKDLEQLAFSQQTTGETYLRLGRPEEAVANFRSALDYWKQKKVESVVTEQLVQQLINAYLQSKQYHQACSFGSEQIAASRAQQETVGSAISNEADRLFRDGDERNDVSALKDSQALINEAMKMNPALDGRYRDHLDATLKSVQQRLGNS